MGQKYLVLVLLLLASCGGGEDGSSNNAAINPASKEKAADKSNELSRGYPLTSVIWKERQIPVCWLMTDASFNQYQQERASVREAIASTWEANSQVTFTGWGKCSDAKNNGISIMVDASGPRAFMGTQGRNSEPSMWLNFEYLSWGSSCQYMKDHCNRTIAIHEFGHALGFAHEQNRPDRPSWCRSDQIQGPDGNVLVGEWDKDSVMNYCNPTWNGGGVLSPTDVAMVQKYYGEKIPKVKTLIFEPIINFVLAE